DDEEPGARISEAGDGPPPVLPIPERGPLRSGDLLAVSDQARAAAAADDLGRDAFQGIATAGRLSVRGFAHNRRLPQSIENQGGCDHCEAMETKSRLALVAALVAILVALAGLAVLWWSVSRPGAPGNDQVQLAPVRTGLPWPIALAFSPDGRVFFAERFSGRIQVLGNTTILDSTFFAIPEIASSGEQGLLGLAVDPNFPNRPYVYVYYTRDDAANGTVYNRIVRIRSSGSIGIGMDVLRDRIAASTIHNSGVIEFGPDGKLYALVGDAANSASAQDLSGPTGKVLRINPDGTVPSDNP